jgi:hypothetical protein
MPRRLAPVSALRPSRAKGREKFIPAKIPRNPLKRLDSDERIQGNPSFSNPLIEGFRGQLAWNQENPNGQPASLAPTAEKEPNRLHPTAQRSEVAGARSASRAIVQMSSGALKPRRSRPYLRALVRPARERSRSRLAPLARRAGRRAGPCSGRDRLRRRRRREIPLCGCWG